MFKDLLYDDLFENFFENINLFALYIFEYIFEYALYFISNIELFFKNVNRWYIIYLKSDDEIINYKLEFYTKGILSYETNITYIENFISAYNILENLISNKIFSYDMIILSCSNTDKNIILYNHQELVDIENLFSYDKVGYTFLLIELNLKNSEEKYEILLREKNKYDFYVDKNVIDEKFIRYYLINELDIDIDSNNKIEYIINFVDNNVNFHHINENNKLLFNKTSYTLI